MSTRESASALLNMMSEPDIRIFLNLFGRIYNVPKEEQESDGARLAKKKEAFNYILENPVKLPPDFDEKQELLDYLDERYGL